MQTRVIAGPVTSRRRLQSEGCYNPVAAGVDVVFAGSGKEMRHVTAAGFPTVPLWEPPKDELFGAIRARQLNFVSSEAVRRMVSADLELFGELHPTAVLSDGRFSACISTRIAGIRHGAIVNASSTRFRRLPYMPFFADIASRIPPIRPLLVRLEYTLFNLLMRTFRDVSREFQIPQATTPTDCLTGNELTLIPDLPEFFPTRHLPRTYHYLGPLTWKPAKGTLQDPEIPENNATEPLIYLTMGTTGDDAFLRAVRDLLTHSPLRAVITTAGQAPGLASLPGKLSITDYADGDLLCQQADIVVCHGGNGTIYQALRQGKPVVGIPFIPDQEYNMRRVEGLGLGRTVMPKDFYDRPQSLLEAITEQLGSADTRMRCQRFGERIRAQSLESVGSKLIQEDLLEPSRRR